jgi:hypothetical protein
MHFDQLYAETYPVAVTFQRKLSRGALAGLCFIQILRFPDEESARGWIADTANHPEIAAARIEPGARGQ